MLLTGYMPSLITYVLFFGIISPLVAYIICYFSEEKKRPDDKIKINNERLTQLIIFFCGLSIVLFISLQVLMEFGYNSSVLYWNLLIAIYFIAAVMIFINRYERKSALIKFSIFYYILTCVLVFAAYIGSEYVFKVQKSFYAEPLREAIISGKINNVKQAVMDGADVNKRFRAEDELPICAAGFKGKKDIIAFFIKSGANIDNIDCLAYLSYSEKYEEIIQILSSKRNIKLKNKNDAVEALRVAIMRNDVRLVKSLVEAGAPIKGWRTIDWNHSKYTTALSYARAQKSRQVIEYLTPMFDKRKKI